MGKYSWSDTQDQRREERRPVPKKKQVKIPNESAKRKQMNKEYQVVRIQYLLSHPKCEAKIDCVNGLSTQVHHKMGRIGSLLTDTKHFLAVCGKCHAYLELNPIEAKELGFSESRLNK